MTEIPALAQSRKQVYDLELGSPTLTPAAQETIVRSTVRVQEAKWLRLQVGEFNLGKESFLLLTSLQDQGRQRLTAQTLAEWGRSSAYFNGEAVNIELHIAAGETGVTRSSRAWLGREDDVSALFNPADGGFYYNSMADIQHRARRRINPNLPFPDPVAPPLVSFPPSYSTVITDTISSPLGSSTTK